MEGPTTDEEVCRVLTLGWGRLLRAGGAWGAYDGLQTCEVPWGIQQNRDRGQGRMDGGDAEGDSGACRVSGWHYRLSDGWGGRRGYHCRSLSSATVCTVSLRQLAPPPEGKSNTKAAEKSDQSEQQIHGPDRK